MDRIYGEKSFFDWLEERIGVQLKQGMSTADIIESLETEGYEVVTDGVYPVGVHVGNSTYYTPQL